MNTVLLFDFDGTIADSYDNFLIIIDRMTDKYKLPKLTHEEIELLRLEDASIIVKKLKIPFYKIPFMARDMKKMQSESISSLKPFNGVPEVLHELKKKGVTLGIVTSNGESNVKIFLQNHDIDIFDFFYGDIGLLGKADAIHKVIKRYKLVPDDVFYVGDEIRDIKAAHKAGIKVIAVGWGFNLKEGLIKYNPDYFIESPKELLSLL